MIDRFYDPLGGGFFDTAQMSHGKEELLGVLDARRKPFQDSPTPAGNSAAAIALVRMHGYTNDQSYREKAEQTMNVFAGVAEQYGIFGGTYGVAGVYISQPHAQVIVVDDERADELYKAAIAPFAFNKQVIRLKPNEVAQQNLPPALAETIPNLPGIKEGKSMAVICADFSCHPPISNPAELARQLQEALRTK